MKWLMGLVLLGMVGLAAVFGAGSVLPREQTLIRGLSVKAPIEQVWQAITDYASSPAWTGNTRVERLSDQEGHAVWRIAGVDGHVTTLMVEVAEAPKYQRVLLLEAPGIEGGSWSFELSPQPDGGTFVKMTQSGKLKNPLWRFLSRYFVGPDVTLQRYLEALGQKFGGAGKVQELLS